MLVTYDLLGLFDRFRPKFVKRYAEVSQTIRQAVGAYIQEVRTGVFPGREQTVSMPPEEFAKLKEMMGSS